MQAREVGEEESAVGGEGEGGGEEDEVRVVRGLQEGVS